MAFSTTNVRTMGLGGGRRLLTGQWTGNSGDAAGTLNVVGGVLFDAQFMGNIAGTWIVAPVSYTTGNGTNTNQLQLTIENFYDVTNGVFKVLYA